MTLEFFDRSTPSKVAPRTLPFLTFDKVGSISLSAAFVEAHNLTEQTLITFARDAKKRWFMAFSAVEGRLAFTPRRKDIRKGAALVFSSILTTSEVLAAHGKPKTNSVRLFLVNEPIPVLGCQWFLLQPEPAPMPSPELVVEQTPAPLVAAVVAEPKKEALPPLPVFEITPGSDRRIGNVHVAGIKTMKGRHAYLTAKKDLTTEEAKELGQVDRRLRRELGEL